MVEDEGREELAEWLAVALTNRGATLRQQGKLAEAVEDHTEAIRIRRHLVEDELPLITRVPRETV